MSGLAFGANRRDDKNWHMKPGRIRKGLGNREDREALVFDKLLSKIAFADALQKIRVLLPEPVKERYNPQTAIDKIPQL